LQFRAKQLVGVAIVLLAIASLTMFAQSKTGQRELRRIGVTAPPPPLTALALVDPAGLPTALHERPAAIAIPFTITNQSTSARSYRWEIVAAGTRRRMLSSGSVRVARAQTATVSPRLKLGCAGRTRVNVLLSSGDSVGFWASCFRSAPVGPERRPAVTKGTVREQRHGRHRTATAG
jgi:hypothetical protein